MILKWFKVAWDLQGDGDQTNASLCPASTKKLTDHLIKANILQEGQQVSGYKIEESRTRHVLGSFCFPRCIRMCQRMDYSPLKTFAVQLVCKNLNHMTELPLLIDHALAFNKAFPPALCIQCTLLCLNSTHLKTYTDIKASCGKMNLEHSPITFNYNEIMKHLGFSTFSKISGLKMNCSGT